MVTGRWQHHNCTEAIARMDARRRAKGKPPVTGRTLVAATRWDNHAGPVTIINATTGEIVDRLAPLANHQVDAIVRTGNRKPRTWDQYKGSRGGGTHT